MSKKNLLFKSWNNDNKDKSTEQERLCRSQGGHSELTASGINNMTDGTQARHIRLSSAGEFM